MPYTSQFHCRTCRGELFWKEVVYSDGVCPLCGADSTTPIVEHYIERTGVKEVKTSFLRRIRITK